MKKIVTNIRKLTSMRHIEKGETALLELKSQVIAVVLSKELKIIWVNHGC
jgi:hypothetical protein